MTPQGNPNDDVPMKNPHGHTTIPPHLWMVKPPYFMIQISMVLWVLYGYIMDTSPFFVG